MNNPFKAKQNAVAEFEQLLIENNWQDGYGIDKSYYERDNTKPLFFRNAAPAIDDKFAVQISGQKRTIYMMYNVIGDSTLTANDVPYYNSITVQIGIDIWYDDPFNFSEDADESTIIDDIYMNFGEDLSIALLKNKWTIDGQGEVADAVTGTDVDYMNHMSMLIEKRF